MRKLPHIAALAVALPVAGPLVLIRIAAHGIIDAIDWLEFTKPMMAYARLSDRAETATRALLSRLQGGVPL